jgi:hypothetical protein
VVVGICCSVVVCVVWLCVCVCVCVCASVVCCVSSVCISRLQSDGVFVLRVCVCVGD